MRSFFLFMALSFATLSSAQEAEKWFSKDQDSVVVRAFYDDQAMLQSLANEKAIWQVDQKKSYAVIQINEIEQLELIEAGFDLHLDRERTQELQRRNVRLPNQRAGIPGFPCYRTVDETYATAQQLAADYPDLAQWIDIGDSWEKENTAGGHDLRVLKLTNQAITGDKPKLFSMSAIHAREYTTAELNTRFAEYLLSNYATNADARWILDHHEVHLSLQSNPDGREQAQTGLSWRKNTNQNYCGSGSNSRGADLNRNFDFGWGCCNGSSGAQCSETYRGSAPGSEPEVEAIQDYVRANFPDQRGPGVNDAAPADAQNVFLDIHSFSELVLYPWGNITNAAPNQVGLRTLARKFAFFNGYEPQQATQLYITDGTTDDFAYGDLGLAAYTFELGTTFFQSCGVFENTILPDNMEALIYAAKTARAPYQLPAGPDVSDLGFGSATVIPGVNATVTAAVSDARYNNSNGTEPTQNVASANAYIDVPPWQAGAVAVPLSAVDGSFNSSTENVTGSLDTTGLSLGEHIVYVQATDSAGNLGVVSAEFIYAIDPANSPMISGNVTAADTGAGIAATVSAGGFQTMTDPSTGAYQLTVIAGDYSVSVTPASNDYGATSVSGVTATDGDTSTINFSLFPFCEVFSDDFETTANAWTSTGNWARTEETSNSPTFSWTDSPGGSYGNNQSVSLTSPVLDLTGLADPKLSFAQICATEATYDFCNVEVSTDGSNWSAIAQYDETNGSNWSTETLSMSSIAGSATARVRFNLTTDVTVLRDGWHVDDVSISAAGAQCITAVDTDSDGVFDNLDNCTLVSNPGQLDVDGDGYGNICDGDFNNDGVINFLDLPVFAAGFGSAGVLETDLNGDGVTNFIDLPLFRDMFLGVPGPSGLVSP